MRCTSPAFAAVHPPSAVEALKDGTHVTRRLWVEGPGWTHYIRTTPTVVTWSASNHTNGLYGDTVSDRSSGSSVTSTQRPLQTRLLGALSPNDLRCLIQHSARRCVLFTRRTTYTHDMTRGGTPTGTQKRELGTYAPDTYSLAVRGKVALAARLALAADLHHRLLQQAPGPRNPYHIDPPDPALRSAQPSDIVCRRRAGLALLGCDRYKDSSRECWLASLPFDTHPRSKTLFSLPVG